MASNRVYISTVTEKGQATIPAKIRKELGIEGGDSVIFELSQGKVTIKKVRPFDNAYHQSLSKTLTEWESKEDYEAYGDL